MIKNTVVVDIDGCLNHYPDPLKMWAEVVLNVDRGRAALAIRPKNDFDLVKKTYRHSPILEYLLPRESARQELEKIKKNGYKIVLLTARNVHKNPNIKDTTIRWLHKYKIPFDSIEFVNEKDSFIKKHESEIAMVVEDFPDHLALYEKLKVEVVIFKNELNKDIRLPNFHSVSSWKEIGSLFERLMAK